MYLKRQKNLQQAATILNAGAVGVLPTDTVYGLVARALDRQATERLYRLKRREHKPGTIIAASTQQLIALGIQPRYLTIAKQWWPNAVSVVMPAEGLSYLHQGLDSLAVRIPKDKALQKLLLKTGPLVSSSANAPGAPVAVTLQTAWDYFKDTVDFYVDGGDYSNRQPSTVIKLNEDGSLQTLRQGIFDPVTVKPDLKCLVR